MAKPLILLLIFSTIFRLILSQTLGFGVDESYMLAHAPHLSLSYFDHPPLHVWLAHVSQLLFGETSKAVRLPFVLLFTGTSYLLYLIAAKVYSKKAALWAVFALNMGLFYNVSAGMMVVPDGLLLFFLALSTWILLYTDKNPRLWLLFGVTIGLAGLSKYHALIYGLGVFCYLFTQKRLNNLWVWMGGFIAVLLQMPTIIWNYQNGWASIAMQGGRGALKGLNFNQFSQMIGGEILWLSPLVALPLLYALYKMPRQPLLYWLGFPTILLFSVTPLWGERGLPHWTMSGWFFLFPLFGAWLAQYNPMKYVYSCTGFLLLAAALVVPHVHNGYLRPLFGRIDPALEAVDWPVTLQADLIITDSWINGGKLYIASKGKIPIYIANKDKRHFAFHPARPWLVGKDAMIIGNRDMSCLAAYFETISEAPAFISFGRGHLKDFTFKMYRGNNLRKPLEGACG